jgi:pimeloyl-ACP methyl ester carboxylesterase
LPTARREGPFPTLALPGLDGTTRALGEAWSEGEALFLIGHRDCIHRRRGPGRAVRLILQDDVETAAGLVKDLALEVPVRLEGDPYPVAADLGLIAVPTLFLVGTDGRIAGMSEGFRRADLEAFAARLGAAGPLFVPEDEAPEFRPG